MSRGNIERKKKKKARKEIAEIDGASSVLDLLTASDASTKQTTGKYNIFLIH